jgi:outer membrane lipoprotein-sorting protein
MKKHFIYLFLFLLNASILFAQKEYQAVNDVSLVKKQIKTASAKLKTMQADFVQDKNLTFLDEIIQSKGRFVFRSPNSVRWEYTEPYYYLIIIDNGSSKQQYDILKQSKQLDKSYIKFLRSDINLGFGGGNMLGVNISSKESNYYFFLNNDIILLNDVVGILHKYMEQNRI